MVESWVERSPEGVALDPGGPTVIYRALAARTNRLARALRRKGVRPEVRVGVCAGRSAEGVVALLAVLRAGGVYVPLDPAYPRERLAWLASDAGVRLVLADADGADAFPADDAELVRICDAEAGAAGEGETRFESGADPDGLAYVIYTSGSTGRPKGVGVTHRGLANMAAAQVRALGTSPGDRVLRFAAPGFDASVWEVFGALAAGAALVLAPRENLLPGAGLARLLDERRVTVATLPPSALAVLPADELPHLRVLVSAGEACTPEIVARWAPGRRFVNAYGPTETAVCATLAVCEPDGRTPPIGAAIEGAAAYVLDSAGSEADDGELYVGGAGVARGYLGRPALTAASFVPDPFSAEPGARLYRTGDRVRWRESAEVRECGSASDSREGKRTDALTHSRTCVLEFLGRLDAQVKVRGHRVEPGEVEAALAAHPAVAQAAVVARSDAPGGRLVAYVVPAPGSEAPAPDELRSFLARTLPTHMVPSAFVAVAAFPLTPNGKTDRGALPAPPAERPALDAAYRPPETEAERAVAGVWAEVLGMSGIGADDEFAALGGTSLAATQVAARLRARLGAEVSEAALLGRATVADVARAVEASRSGDAAAEPPLVPVPRGGDLPLAYSQERVWFLTRLAPDNRSYHANAFLRFRGALDVGALEAGLSAVVARHEAFRTTFHEVDGRPVQRIHAPWPVHLPIVDLSSVPADERDAAEEARVREALDEAFDLEQLPLVRWTLLRLSADEHLLVHVEHHVIHDGWSFNLFLRELDEAYRARVEGRAPRLPDLPVQFADFCVWQRAWMRSEAGRAQVEFWRRRLAGSPPVLALPLDRPRPPEQSFHGAAPRFALPRALWERVRALAAREGATPFMVMLAAFDILLSRWSGEDDVAVGTAIAARRRHETEGVVGMFVNSVVLRADLSGDPSFRELLARVRRETGEAYAHQDVPFDAVVEAVQPERTLSHNPVFQVMFSFHDSAMPELRLPGVEVEATVGVGNGSAKFDMNLVVVPPARGDEPAFVIWEYSTDLWEAGTIGRMAAQLRRLLEAAADDPEARVSTLPLLEGDERRRVLEMGIASTAGAPPRALVHTLIKAQAARTPDAAALSFEGRSLTYAELDARAARLARRLRRLGVGPETRVAVCLERGVEMVAALLAVLKAGGAYVPVDPSYPAERLALVLEDSGAAVVITRSTLRDALPPHAAAVIDVDLDGESEADPISGEADDLPSTVVPENAAYVIYTSGSTGRPKGVVVPHAAVVNFLASMAERPGMGAGDVVLAVTTLSFDIAVLELLLPLTVGARVEVASRATATDAEALARALEATGATVMQATPSTWRMLVLSGWPGKPGLRALCGGEALPAELAGELARRSAEVWNLYGPTETTVWSAAARVDGTHPVPLGEPVAHTGLYVVDGRMEPTPGGVPGELLIGGAGVTRGYLGRPVLTAERFVPDPFSGTPGARLYRTGDRVRWKESVELRECGSAPGSPVAERTDAPTHSRTAVLEYLGRTDFQVKVRGHRIEPREIEAALRAHASVSEAAVIAREDAPGERRLVAYVAPAAGGPRPTPGEVREHLGASLPDYMVPAAVVVLDRLPLTPNGKLDRRALPAPAGTDLERAAYAAPETPAERVLAAVWSEVLGVERVGVDDNYFRLGGDSIRAVQVVSRARRRGLELSLADLFRRQTVRALASVARLGEGGGHPARTAPFSLVDEETRRALPADVEDAYPLTRLQLGMLYHSELKPGSLLYLNVHGYRVEAPFDEAALRRALAAVTARHPVLRTSFALGGFAEPMQLVHRRAEVPLEVVDLRARTPGERERALDVVMAAERRRRFDFGRAPLLRAAACRLTEDEFQLSLTLHHAILDGWSVATLVAELLAAYATERNGTGDAGEAPAATFRDFVALEQEALRSPEARGFWRERLAGAEPTRLPRAPEPPPAGGGRGDEAPTHAVAIPAEVQAGLERLAAAAGVPLRSVLLAAHLRVLSVLGGTDDVVSGVVVGGRPEDEGGERALGLFLNTVPLRLALPGGTWAELARAVFRAEWDALPFRRYPLGEIQAEAGRGPLFEAAFSFNHFHALRGSGGVRFRGDRFFQKTELPLVATFTAGSEDGRLGLRLEHDPRAIGAARAATIGAVYSRALEVMAAGPEGRYEAAPLLDEAGRRRVLADWNDTARPYPRESSIHAVFAEQARRAPDAVALVSDGERVTYGELEARANRLARHLRALGVGPESRVGVSMERSADLIVSLVAILKAGGAYVPLDPSYPPERLEWMRRDAGIAVLIVDGDGESASTGDGVRVVSIARDADAIAAQADSAPEGVVSDPESLAYVVYTSGSTGRPKGVAVPHRAVLRLVLESDFARFGADETWLQMAPVAFDASTLEIWGALLHGSRLAMFTSRAPTLDELGGFLGRHGVTSLWLTAGLFHALADAAPEALGGARQLLAGGDVLSPPHLKRVMEMHPGLSLINGYGPTENTTFTCCHHVRPADLEGAVPIGRPVTNTRVYVLDPHGQPVPVGAPGELYAAGDGVARGYLGRPALTAERFVPDPFGAPGGRMYRTGDRARWNERGEVEFLGRLDGQVKVRGFRVETGEVEAALLRHPGVREAAVAVRGDGADRRLVAYVVADGPQAPSAEELRAAVREWLPEHMVPSAVVPLPALPLDPHGKVDRRALPEPVPEPAGTSAIEAPRTETERRMAELWAHLLGRGAVGVGEDFFALGGNSLVAMLLMAEVRTAFRVDLPLAALFAAPTVEALSREVERRAAEARPAPGPGIASLARAGRRVRLPAPASAPEDGAAGPG